MSRVEFVLNGKPVTLETDPRKPLLRVLRDELNLTGVKQGCDTEGECGACTVIVNGQAVRACLLPVGKLSGSAITTVEGLGTPEHPHPLQTAFLAAGAVQCGYCTPGMLLSAKALLDREPNPTREQIIAALDGNLCRCTGYVKIIQAVETAAAMLRGEMPTAPVTSDAKIVGGSLERHRGWERVSGATRYAEDMQLANLHYMRVVRSPYFHARVVHLDAAPALDIAGVVRVLTAEDVPGENGLSDYSQNEHLLAPVGGKVRMIGDPIVLVIGVSPEAAGRGAAAVRVEYEQLPYTTEIAGALEPDALLIHEGGNLLASDTIQAGDVASALVESDVRVETNYRTSFQAHMSLERESGVGYIDEAGRVTIVCGNHEPHWNCDHLAYILGLPREQIRIITPPMGGSFGGKQDIWPLAALALAVYHLRQPVQLAYTRQEVMNAATKRHAYDCRCIVGAKKDGALTGMRFEARVNTGAYDSAGRYIANYANTASIGPYRWQAAEARAWMIYSNGPKAGQFRGFGSPQATFAMECTLDELTQQLNVDPLEFRMQNALTNSDVTVLGYRAGETLGYREVLEAIRPDYEAARKRTLAFNENRKSSRRRGVGLAGMWYRFGKYGRPTSQAQVELGLDGRFTIYSSACDYGQGIETVLCQLAAENLRVSRAVLNLVNADSASTLDGDVTGASRSTYWVGGAVGDASRRLRAAILATASEMLGQPPDRLALTDESVQSLAGLSSVTLREVAQEMERCGEPRRVHGRMDLRAQFPDNERNALYLPMFVTAAHVAEVEVNVETGETRVLSVSAAHDVGHAINPRDAEGQIEGSIVMGLGSVLMEEFVPGLSTGFSNYMIPTMRSTPEIRVHLVEVPSRYGPWGAKGLGEAAMLPVAPALVNALSRAIGVRVRRLPATGERILAAIQGKA